MADSQHRYEPLRQPPDPVDLRRQPPESPECARMRGLMRDYADSDLPPALVQDLEAHVHGCRACAVALSRAEHEVVRLRRAFALTPPRPVPAGFARRTVARLLAEDDGTEVRAPETPAAVVPATSVRPRRRGMIGLTVAALLLGGLLAVPPIPFWRALHQLLLDALAPEVVEVEQRAGLLLLEVDDGWLENAGGRLAVEAGDRVEEGVTFGLGSGQRGGKAKLELFAAGGGEPAARLEMHGRGRLRLQGGKAELDLGTLRVDAAQPTLLRLGDESEVQLGIGRYHIDVIESFAFDAALTAIADRKVRVEVQDGEPAQIRRGKELVVLGAGQAARYRGSEVAIDVQPGSLTFAGAIGRHARERSEQQSNEPGLVGAVYERPAGSPSVGSNVILSFLAGQRKLVAAVGTDLNGSFAWSGTAEVTANFAVVQCMPPMGRPDLGITAPDALPLLRTGSSMRFTQPFVLDPSPLTVGVVVDHRQRPLFGAMVVPCIYDELFGLLLPWVEATRSTNAGGVFVLRSLPTRLPPHQSLGVVVLHPWLQPRFSPLPLPGSSAASLLRHRIELAALRVVDVHGLPESGRCEILEELPGLPRGTGARRCTATADAGGRLLGLQLGEGRLWLSTGTAARPQLRALVPHQEQSGVFVVSQDPPRDLGSVFRSLLPLPGSDFMLSREFRHEHFRAADAAAGEFVAVDDLFGRLVQHAQLFAVSPAAGGVAVRFIGLQDGYTPLRGELDPHERQLVAIGPDGGLATLDAGPISGMGRQRGLVLQGAGGFRLGATMRPDPAAEPVVELTLLPEQAGLFGERPVLFRFASADEAWVVGGVPPGAYEVRDGRGRSQRVVVEPRQIVDLP